jgi:hypothetical protein
MIGKILLHPSTPKIPAFLGLLAAIVILISAVYKVHVLGDDFLALQRGAAAACAIVATAVLIERSTRSSTILFLGVVGAIGTLLCFIVAVLTNSGPPFLSCFLWIIVIFFIGGTNLIMDFEVPYKAYSDRREGDPEPDGGASAFWAGAAPLVFLSIVLQSPLLFTMAMLLVAADFFVLGADLEKRWPFQTGILALAAASALNTTKGEKVWIVPLVCFVASLTLETVRSLHPSGSAKLRRLSH